MIPIGYCAGAFALGLLLGWLLARWPARARGAAAAARVEPGPATPAAATAITEEFELPPAAAHVATSRLIDVGAARAAGFNLKRADDLTIIEGIGPKIEELFRSHGIEGFAQVARLDVDDMLAILARGGPAFRFANPSTWAQQAALAAENRWAELKHLQEELIGGADPGT
ncbi:MAG TPA: hypothetical protein VGC30_10260 [Dokdonella sp.]